VELEEQAVAVLEVLALAQELTVVLILAVVAVDVGPVAVQTLAVQAVQA
jgi:hypothetical protein